MSSDSCRECGHIRYPGDLFNGDCEFCCVWAQCEIEGLRAALAIRNPEPLVEVEVAMRDKRMIPCPVCGGDGNYHGDDLNGMVGIGCGDCMGKGTIHDRRKPDINSTAVIRDVEKSEAAVARVLWWTAQPFNGDNADVKRGFTLACAAVRAIINQVYQYELPQPTANDRAVEMIKEWCATIPEPGRPPELCAAESYVCGAIMSIINEEAARG